MVDDATIVDAVNFMEAVQPEHPIFEGVDLGSDTTVEFFSQLGPDDNIDLLGSTDFGFADVIAWEAETEFPWIAYWDGESESGDFFDGSPQFAAGPRLFLSAGSDDDPNTWGEKNITPAGDQIVLNAITFLTGDPGTVVVELPNDCNSDGTVSGADLECILAASGPDGLASLLAETGLLAGDLNADGAVAFPDFLILSANFGMAVTSYTAGDIDGNGSVAFPDFLLLSSNFGNTSTKLLAMIHLPQKSRKDTKTELQTLFAFSCLLVLFVATPPGYQASKSCFQALVCLRQ